MRNTNRPSSLRLGGFLFQHSSQQQKARHVEAVAQVCLNTPSATLRSLEMGDTRRENDVASGYGW